MNQYELPALIADTFPEAVEEIMTVSKAGNPYKTVSAFSQFMLKKLVAQQFSKVFKCMTLADYMYAHGNTAVKNAVENEFVYSFSAAAQSCGKTEWSMVKAHIPRPLYAVYIKQVVGYGS